MLLNEPQKRKKNDCLEIRWITKKVKSNSDEEQQFNFEDLLDVTRIKQATNPSSSIHKIQIKIEK